MTWIEDATGLAPAAFAFAAAMTLGASAVRGLTGFGMAIILVPLLSLVIRPDQAVVLAILLQFVIGPVGIRSILANAQRQTAIPIALIAMLTTPIGLWILARTAPDTARLAIAAIAIGAFVLVIWRRKPDTRPGKVATVVTGAIAGVLTGFAAMPGPPVVPYFLRAAANPAEARASMMLVFFATATAGTLVALLNGLATVQIVWLTLLLLAPMLLGNWLGGLGFGRVSERSWHAAVALILGVAGVLAVSRAW